jgi:glycosyltransferase involved in cell wall biosynthesis
LDTRITVIVAFFNEEKWMPATLKSLKENIDDIDELIFSDNGSTDNSLALVKEAFEGHDHVTILESGLPGGGQRNLWDHMRRLCRGVQTPYLMFFRAKDFVNQGYFSAMKRAFAEHQEAVGFYPVIEMYRETYVSTEKCFAVWRPKKLLRPLTRRERIRFVYASQFSCHLLWCPVRTELFQTFFDHVEDSESGADLMLAFRCALQAPLFFVSNATWYRRYRQESIKDTYRRYKTSGKFIVPVVNPFWYIPYNYWSVGKLYAPELFTDEARPRFDMFIRMLYDADWRDADWMARHTYETVLLHLSGLIDGRSVIIFGTGEDARNLYPSLQGKLEIQEAWDNHASEESEFFGLSVKKPYRHCGAFIIIASQKYQMEMLEQLEELGYVYERDWIAVSEMRILLNEE